MSFIDSSDSLRQFIGEVARDEGLELYDAERLGRASLRIWVTAGEGTAADGTAGMGGARETAPETDRHADGDVDGEMDGGVDGGAPEEDTAVEESAGGDSSGSVHGRGVTIGQCGRLCRRLMVVFQAEGGKFGLPPEPEIEVSSPGVNRTLRLPEHFLGAVGERVRVVWEQASAEGGRKSGTTVGTLERYQDPEVTVRAESDGSEVVIRRSEVKRAQVDFRF